MNTSAEPRGLSLGRPGTSEVFLGRYQSDGFLGSGSMGKVYVAHPFGVPDRKVVVKVMHSHVAADPKARQLFEREIQSLARLKHPYIVQLLDSSVNTPRGPALVMEFVPGITLESYIAKKRRLAIGHAGLILGYLCQALEAAHKHGIVHLDLKPANLMIVNADTLEESLRVMDFGLARFASKPHFTEERLAGHAKSTAEGTPNYIAPEQLRADEIDGRADIYSTGVILYEMITGQLPFDADDANAILRAHLQQRPMSFASVGVRDIPPAVEQVVQLCLSKYPVERPQSAREVARQFSEALGVDVWEAAQPEVAPETAPAATNVAEITPRNAISRHLEAWMPERIAVVKLRGFLEDMGGRVVESEPGILRMRLGEPQPQKGKQKSEMFPMPVEIALLMEKPDARDNRLLVTALFRPFTDPILLQSPAFRDKCDGLFKELQAYLMAR